MCARTKVTYGCGHVYRTTIDCDSPDCTGLDKYLITKDGDCKACKREGSASTRGRDGFGRYAQEIQSRERSRSMSYEKASTVSSVESVTRHSTSATTPRDAGISPWAASVTREKAWESPHRKQADEAWLSEHESRISDLQRRLENVHVSQQYEPQKSRRRQFYESDEEDEEDEEETIEDHRNYLPPRDARVAPESPATRKCTSEIRRSLVDTPSQRSRSGRSQCQEVRQYSYDSLPDSMPSYKSSPRHKTQSNMRHTYPERSYDYDYYTGHSTPTTVAKRSSGRAKTEPYAYSRSTTGYDYDYDYAHPVIADSLYSYNSPKYYAPQRSVAYRYKPVEPSHMSSYVRYQPRY